MTVRIDGRASGQLRPIKFTPGFVKYPEGSVLIECGDTRVLCNVSIENSVPGWILNSATPHGWITGEYAMLPRSTHTRMQRETKGPKGRTQEIQRLVGRALRAAVDLEALGQRTCLVDCDVLQADGGTRTAAITGGYVALQIALQKLITAGEISQAVWRTQIAAISVGIVNGTPLLDLNYAEDSRADTDMNIVMTKEGKFIELQGTAERNAFSLDELYTLTALGQKGIEALFNLQNETLALLSV